MRNQLNRFSQCSPVTAEAVALRMATVFKTRQSSEDIIAEFLSCRLRVSSSAAYSSVRVKARASTETQRTNPS